MALGAEAARAVMLAASARIAELRANAAPGPHTPSGAVPPYAKPATPERGHDPCRTIADALTDYAATGRVPPLPAAVADG